eukprot:m.66039 g.66039  ORF g.66039 m.66039 type:complete len:347 (-) comp7371_c0_seq2:212-1252(-)
MAGLDTTRRSDFLSMLLETSKTDGSSAFDPPTICGDTRRIIQMTSEALLLRERDRSLSQQPFSGCCDTLVGKTKSVSIIVGSIQSSVQEKQVQSVCQLLGELAEGIAVLTETAAQAAFLVGEYNPRCTKATPSVIDHYALARGRLAIQLAVDVFTRPTAAPANTMAASAVIATHLEVLRDECTLASDRCADVAAKQQFKACSKALSAVTSMLVLAIKEFVRRPTPGNRAKCVMFSKPLLECVDSVTSYVHSDPSFTGTPAVLPPDLQQRVRPMLAAAMSVVSSAGLFIAACKAAVCDNDTSAQVSRYALALDHALDALTQSAKAAKAAGICPDPPEVDDAPARDYD